MKNGSSPKAEQDRPMNKVDAWEIEDIHRHFPKHTYDEVLEALQDCQEDLSGSTTREKILQCMGTRLSPQAADGVD
ncbi:MAG: hypothetical protein ACK4UN_10530 [Limisphaerales bacterium]